MWADESRTPILAGNNACPSYPGHRGLSHNILYYQPPGIEILPGKITTTSLPGFIPAGAAIIQLAPILQCKNREEVSTTGVHPRLGTLRVASTVTILGTPRQAVCGRRRGAPFWRRHSWPDS